MIEFKNVTKEFKDKVVLSDISMEIEDKRLTVLIGPSGCGKTTTLKMINRLIHPTAGDIFIDGENIDELDPVKLRRRMGYVIQQGGLFPHMTIRQNIEIIERLEKRDAGKIAENTKRLMKMVDLDPAEYLDSYHQRGFFRELESGRIGADEFVRRLGECAGREVSYAEAREAWLGFFLLPVPLERLACLEELRRDYRLYVLSNTNPFVMDWARSSEFSPAGKPLDAYFDKLFLSYEMKCMKPDRAIFDRMAAEAPLVPAETLFIDDSAANAAAGAALGYRTFCPRSNSDWREEVRRILGAGV